MITSHDWLKRVHLFEYMFQKSGFTISRLARSISKKTAAGVVGAINAALHFTAQWQQAGLRKQGEQIRSPAINELSDKYNSFQHN